MDNLVVRDMADYLRRLFDGYHRAGAEGSVAGQRDCLLQMRSSADTMRIAMRAEIVSACPFLSSLEASDAELVELLDGYQRTLTTPDEKRFLGLIQNCVLRAQVAQGPGGAKAFLARMNKLQEGRQVHLVLV